MEKKRLLGGREFSLFFNNIECETVFHFWEKIWDFYVKLFHFFKMVVSNYVWIRFANYLKKLIF